MPEHKSPESIMKELSEIMDMIGKTESLEQLPAIERDIVLSKLRQVYENFSDVPKKVGETGDQIELEAEAVIPEPEDVINDTLELEEPEEEVFPDEIEEQFTNQPEEPVADQPEEIPEEPVEHIQDEKVQKMPEDKQSENGINDQPGTIADKLTNDKQVVYDSLAEKSSRDNISTKMQSKPIADIAAAIGINDKFQLIRDLFNGDSSTFNKTLEILNGATNFNEAFSYINENFDWDMEDPSVQFILELVRRKFIVKKDE